MPDENCLQVNVDINILLTDITLIPYKVVFHNHVITGRVGESDKTVNWKAGCLETLASILPNSAGAPTRTVRSTALAPC